jgi:hypothetical protein
LNQIKGVFYPSSPLHYLISQNKLFQLQAGKNFFKIPEYVISRNLKDLEAFFLRMNGKVIYKPLSSPIIDIDSERHVVLPVSVNQKQIEQLRAVCDEDHMLETPLYFQQKIEAAVDIRINVIGNEIIPLKIIPKTKNPEKIDRRDEWVDSEYEILNLTEDFKQKLISFQKELNLNYGAFDFLLDANDTLWFLEINPGGQFLWPELIFMENGIDLNLSKTFAEHLAQIKPALVQ